ncbi:peptidylprolyl isomerase [Baia soyae]|uniref:Peptidyl-prolyl cis-trans isomerase n=1 Tax=Baia soyae TaxID=1544746 RepID=A0A4R2S2D7_9BACL|nr:peptidylprolyl isomerase [Baia soyae]TCP66481.1 peptidyl-prolyl cis-trans isomerase B (cyclophilin B) [Baia soyae]
MKTGYVLLEDGSKMELEFYDEAAPNTVANFEKLANEGFYDGLNFHRVIKGFVSQGGCPQGTGVGSAGYQIKCETTGNPHKHVAGSLSMAHAGKDTGSCQFFVVHDPQPHLDGVHTVFGQVTSGLEHAQNMKQGAGIKEIRVQG